MKRPFYFASITGTILLTVALLTGCTSSSAPGEAPGDDTAPDSTPTEESPQNEEPQQSDEDLEGILGKASDIDSMKFDIVMTNTGMEPMTYEVWLKDNKMKTKTTSQGQTVINIVDQDAQTMYMYMPDQNTAFQTSYEETDLSPIDEIETVLQYDPVTTGTETIDGKSCMVIEYTMQDTSSTAWIWTDYGLPIKVVYSTPESTTTIEYKNIDFTDIPDSEFQLPEGVQIMDYPTQAEE